MEPVRSDPPCADAMANAAARCGDAAVVLRQCADLASVGGPRAGIDATLAATLDANLDEALAACADGASIMVATAEIVSRATPDRLRSAVATAHAALAVAQRAAELTAAVQDVDERLRSAANALRRADSALRTMLEECAPCANDGERRAGATA